MVMLRVKKISYNSLPCDLKMTKIYFLGRTIENISPDILNEQIRLMADLVLCCLLANIRSFIWFAILADEATDVKFNEQMCVAIRWVDEVYEIHEGPLGLVQVPST